MSSGDGASEPSGNFFLTWDLIAARHRMAKTYGFTCAEVRSMDIWTFLGYETMIAIENRAQQEYIENMNSKYQ